MGKYRKFLLWSAAALLVLVPLLFLGVQLYEIRQCMRQTIELDIPPIRELKKEIRHKLPFFGPVSFTYQIHHDELVIEAECFHLSEEDPSVFTELVKNTVTQEGFVEVMMKKLEIGNPCCMPVIHIQIRHRTGDTDRYYHFTSRYFLEDYHPKRALEDYTYVGYQIWHNRSAYRAHSPQNSLPAA